jgi:hypothetical protein
MFNSVAKSLLVPERFYSLFDVLLIAVFIMFILLKIVSLRRSWINGQKVWFWVLIFVNTLGILEMIYLLSNKEDPKPRVKKQPKEKKIEEAKPKIIAAPVITDEIIIDEPATSVHDIDNQDLIQEEVIENFNEIATENEIPEANIDLEIPTAENK